MPSWLPKAGITIAAVIGGAWYLMRPGSYDECVLAEMRGQAQAMHSTVHKVCARRFGLEVPVDLPEGFSWFVTIDDRVSATPVKRNSELQATSASFQLSPKDCSLSSDDDFSPPITRTRVVYEIFEFPLPPGFNKPVCMRWRDVKGLYR
jgi:hypothetical protein